jgi:hypothetical protein
MVQATSPHPYTMFQRAGSTRWWVRFSIRGEGQIRKPLGTSDQREAERLALEAWAEAKHRNKQGLRSQPKSFRAVAEEFIAHLQLEADRSERRQFQVDQYRRKVERYFVGFFADQLASQVEKLGLPMAWMTGDPASESVWEVP